MSILWDTFISKLSPEDQETYYDFANYCNSATPTIDIPDIETLDNERLADLFEDYNRYKEQTGGGNPISSAKINRLKRAFDSIDPCADRSSISSLLEQNLSSADSRELGPFMDKIVKTMPIGPGPSPKPAGSLEEFFTYYSGLNSSDKSGLMNSLVTKLSQEPCYSSSSLAAASDFSSRVNDFRDGITSPQQFTGTLTPAAEGAPSPKGVTMLWLSSADDIGSAFGAATTNEHGEFILNYDTINIENYYSSGHGNIPAAAFVFLDPDGNPVMDPNTGTPMVYPFPFPPSGAPAFPDLPPTAAPFSPINQFYDPATGVMDLGFSPSSSLYTWLVTNEVYEFTQIIMLGGINSVITDPVLKDTPEVKKVDSLAYLSLVSDDLALNNKLADSGIENIADIAEMSPTELMDVEPATSIEETDAGDYNLAEVYETANALTALLDNQTIEWSTEND